MKIKKILCLIISTMLLLFCISCRNEKTAISDSSDNSVNEEVQVEIKEETENDEYSSVSMINFLPTNVEYVEAYKNSGMPYSENYDQTNSKTSCVIYDGKNSTNPGALILYNSTSNGTFYSGGKYGIYHIDGTSGISVGYEYILKPALIYTQNIPGAITDWQELLNAIEAEYKKPNGTAYSRIMKLERNGITYYLVDTKDIVGAKPQFTLQVECDPNYKFNLNEYPDKYKEFYDKRQNENKD